MECRYPLALFKGVRISVFSSYTGTKQTGTLKLTAHSQSTAFTWHTQKRDKLDVLKKATTMLRTGTTESTCTPHKLTILFFF